MKADIEKMVADHEGGGYPAAVKAHKAVAQRAHLKAKRQL
jgi:hypothetical protein